MKARFPTRLHIKQFPLLLPIALLLLPGCGNKEIQDPVANAKATRNLDQATNGTAAEYQDPEAEFSKLVFADGQVSVNDKCPVRKVKLNRRMPAVFANGRPVGFC